MLTPVLHHACLDESTVLALAQGELPSRRRAQAELHIDACSLCRRLVAAVLAGSAATLAPAQVQGVAQCLTPGAMVAQRYRVAELLGRGGMGEVYRAFDTLLGEWVALKCVAAVDSDDPRALKRLRAEAQLARRVTHPHVCRIFDVGLEHDGASHPEPLLFLTMELLEGPTLRWRIRSGGRLENAEALRIARQLAAGLEAAHAAQVVHRDFKSDNVILHRAQSPRPVITDFGLARDLASGRALGSSAQGLAGTPAYVAPEQIEGKPPSVATDVYAFGVVLFEMATGRLPFRAQTALATLVKRLTEAPPSPRALVPDLDPRLEQVIAACLQREPAQRLPSMSAVRASLEQPARVPHVVGTPRAHGIGPTRTRLALGLAALATLLGTGFALTRSVARPVLADHPIHRPVKVTVGDIAQRAAVQVRAEPGATPNSTHTPLELARTQPATRTNGSSERSLTRAAASRPRVPPRRRVARPQSALALDETGIAEPQVSRGAQSSTPAAPAPDASADELVQGLVDPFLGLPSE